MTGALVGGQRAVIETAQAMRAAARPFALLLVVRSEGSTYRKPGALALVGSDGTHVGVISGGCLESGIEVLARDAMRAGGARLAVFDTRSDDDLVFGSGSGCRGRMHLLALPSEAAASRGHVDAIMDAGGRRVPITLELCALAPELLADGAVTIVPPPGVLILGAGPEAPPLLRMGRTLGWYCWIAEHREGRLAPDHLPADGIIRRRPGAAVRAGASDRFDAALVMTHVADTDIEALRALAHTDVPFIGLLGPPARRDELLELLEVDERATLRTRLHAPVGLPLGGEGPEAIALAITAQLQQAFNAQR